ncbi:hypothetical protein [Escherichia coli]|uniref:hypothetical protein n=1 Tax=Escherichia coli TaxID=562 RepID=UPI000942F2F2|nr:hypothetical protein [Escherichia coli]EHM8971715.1 hypothetical protein [Escherichia coli]MCX3809190.1 hypothetical protein [Escherichia coli]OKV29565.1 hypothetical protein AWP49_13410 [Escherichia coli]OKX75840.1 hypothetical protein AWP95_01300 [Escherichia coli]HAP6014047.1 hypothetical protein [Escherichia coli]
MTNNINFTKEQLIEQAREDASTWRDAAEHFSAHPAQRQYAAIRLGVAQIALAALTAEPAMYCMKKGETLDIDATSTCKSVVDAWVDEWNEMQCEHGDNFSAVSLYRLPMVEDLSNDQ